jgi:hypothetical protein
MYLVLAVMGVQILLRRRQAQQKVAPYYSLFMLAVTTAWYLNTAIVTEVVMIENADDPDSNSYCAPTNIAAVALSSVQFAGSDLLLVRPSMTSSPALADHTNR